MKTETTKQDSTFFEKRFQEDIERISKLPVEKREKLCSFIKTLVKEKLEADIVFDVDSKKKSIAAVSAPQTIYEHHEVMQFVEDIDLALCEGELESIAAKLKDLPNPRSNDLSSLKERLMSLLLDQEQTVDSLMKMISCERRNVRTVVIMVAVILAGLAIEAAWVLFIK